MSTIGPREREILKRLDPKGEMIELLDDFAQLIDRRGGRVVLRLFKAAGVDLEQLHGPITETRELLTTMALAIPLFAPLGWAPSSRAPVDLYEEALGVYHRTGSRHEAEQHLLDGWNQPDRLLHALMPLQGVGVGHQELREISAERWRLVEKALKHHVNGDYEASVPIVLAQVDGISLDLTDPQASFFKKGKGSHFTDTRTIAGMPGGLEHLRHLFSEDMSQSGATGKLSRNGILHGRELGYDTRINSTKALVLLLAVMEWAQAKAHDLVQRSQREHEQRYAGSDETDESGRRRDRRGFDAVKTALLSLAAGQTMRFQREGTYSDDLQDLAAWLPGRLPEQCSVTVRASGDQRQFWAWGVTPSRYCFGVAGRNGRRELWRYAGPSPPSGGLGSGADWRHPTEDPAQPDW
jgi:hypothetical protein